MIQLLATEWVRTQELDQSDLWKNHRHQFCELINKFNKKRLTSPAFIHFLYAHKNGQDIFQKFVTQKKKSYKFGTPWGQVKDKMLILGWIVPLNVSLYLYSPYLVLKSWYIHFMVICNRIIQISPLPKWGVFALSFSLCRVQRITKSLLEEKKHLNFCTKK